MEWNKTIRTNITNTPPSSSSPSSLLPPFCLPETKEGETSGASGVAWRHCSVGSGRPVAPSSSSRSINRDLINARFLGPLPVHFRFTSGFAGRGRYRKPEVCRATRRRRRRKFSSRNVASSLGWMDRPHQPADEFRLRHTGSKLGKVPETGNQKWWDCDPIGFNPHDQESVGGGGR